MSRERDAWYVERARIGLALIEPPLMIYIPDHPEVHEVADQGGAFVEAVLWIPSGEGQ